ncbi:MAG: glycosyltransferase family 4 protein [Rhodospirillaceae bacterium]|nr:glycosyltransferase family 4 protein [Rhodospirillaceae bacterium]MBT6136174.1 glycosyltransferase family 4 protein [Rhodospirillaceae bacterium]
MKPLRIAVHDYPGHAFPLQLSRALARRGHAVRHISFAGFQAPKGDHEAERADAGDLDVVQLILDKPFAKYDFVRRRSQEIQIGRMVGDAIADFHPDIVLSGNAPIDAQRMVQARCRAEHLPFVYWVQDLNSVAISAILTKRYSLVGRLIGAVYRLIEQRLLRRSDRCVVITDDFVEILTEWGVPVERIDVVENWAPIADIPVEIRDNAWATEQALTHPGARLVYSGTLSLKHDPEMLLQLACSLEERGDGALIVVTEGIGGDHLTANGGDLESLTVLPFQSYERFPQVMGSADILVAILEPDAGVFSVPSKVLSYLCAGRSVLAAMPPENLAAQLIQRTEAGIVVAPGDVTGFLAAAHELIADPKRRHTMGANARRYAEQTFDIDRITDRFETILSETLE